MYNTKSGKKGEERAVTALEAAGMSIIARNIRSKHGEIDIVAIDMETVAFIEVKAWSVYGIEELQYSVGLKKQKRIIETAKHFLSERLEYGRMRVRFDIIFIKGDSVTHFASAFTEAALAEGVC